MYMYVHQDMHPYLQLHGSWVARIRDSAAAVHEAAATLLQEKVIVAFTQGHDDFVALPTGFGNSLWYCCLPDKLRGFTNGSIAVVVSPLNERPGCSLY